MEAMGISFLRLKAKLSWRAQSLSLPLVGIVA